MVVDGSITQSRRGTSIKAISYIYVNGTWVDDETLTADVELETVDPSLNVTKIYVNPSSVEAGNSTELIARFDLSDKATTIELAGKPDYRITTLTEDQHFEVGTHEIRLDIPTTEELEGVYDISSKIYMEVDEVMKEAGSETISFTVEGKEEKPTLSNIYLSNAKVTKSSLEEGEENAISVDVVNDTDYRFRGYITLKLFGKEYESDVEEIQISGAVRGTKTLSTGFTVPEDLGLARNESKTYTGEITLTAETVEKGGEWF